MLLRLLVLFTAVPLLELFVLLWLAGRVGPAATIALVFVTGIIGAVLARWQGLAAIGRFRQAVAAGRVPGAELLDGVLILVAAAVLLTPGLLTDAAGFALLLPWTRSAIARRVGRRLRVGASPGPERVIDARWTSDDT